MRLAAGVGLPAAAADRRLASHHGHELCGNKQDINCIYVGVRLFSHLKVSCLCMINNLIALTKQFRNVG